MGGWYITKVEPDKRKVLARQDAAKAQFSRQGFTNFTPLATKTHVGFACPHILGGPVHFAAKGDDWIAIAGTFFYRGRVGEAALLALLEEFIFPFNDWERVDGQFAAIVAKNGKVHVFNDYFANFQTFHDPLVETVTTSFLSVATGCPTLSLNQQGIYEFVFNAAPTGDDTIFNEVIRLGANRQLVMNEASHAEIVAKPLSEPRPWSQDHAEKILSRLRHIVGQSAQAWNGNIQAPLTGGLDSRLLIALLRDQGVKPHIYVYGPKDNPDVEVAKDIARWEGFNLEIFDKKAWRHIEPDEFAAQVEQNFHEIDGFATDESLFDNGANSHARRQRQTGGALAMSGGCGEIFRNFFFLPNQPMHAHKIVRAFYSGYDSSELTDKFSSTAYERNIAQKIEHTMGVKSETLPRRRIEELYPRFRGRAFFGREISIVGTLGGYVLPFLDCALINYTLDIPFDKRKAGSLQSELLTKLDPRLAQYSSSYGHSFDQKPGFRHTVAETMTVHRPNVLRKSSYAIRNKMVRRQEHEGLLSDTYLGRVIDLEFPVMRRFFKTAKIRNPLFYSRIASLEYLAKFVGSRLQLD